MRLNISWEVDDGYCGKARPQHFSIETRDYLEDDQPYEEMSQQEKDDFIYDRVCEEFNNRISFVVGNVEEA